MYIVHCTLYIPAYPGFKERKMYIVVGIIAFGLLIAVHEVGHFTAAKLLRVRVNEFAIGMGPKILKKQGKETLYTMRALPIGGYCAMDEDVSSDDPRSFTAQKRWRRIVILAAGGIGNIVAASIIIIILVSGMKWFAGTTITDFAEASPNEGEDKLMVGDKLISINGERLYYMDDFPMFMQFAKDNRVDLVIRRDGQNIKMSQYRFEQREYLIDGQMQPRYGITFDRIDANFIESLKYSGYMVINFVRLVRFSLAQLFSGAVGLEGMTSFVGIIDAMNDIGKSAETVGDAIANIAYFVAFIGVNIAVINLLPIPAMDGGRILFVFLTWAIEKITKRKLDAKYEGYIHTTVLFILLGFMVFLLVNDVLRIIKG